MIATAKEISPQPQDALAYLPQRRVVEYKRNEIIYGEQPSSGLSRIIQGKVKVFAIEAGEETVIEILGADEFFGQAALLGKHTTNREQATALEKTVLMTWTRDDIETLIESQPRVGLALIWQGSQFGGMILQRVDKFSLL